MIEPRMVWSYDLQRPEKFLELTRLAISLQNYRITKIFKVLKNFWG